MRFRRGPGYTESPVGGRRPAPLHRALGLTDWEADRIRELLGRDPNHFELAVFSLLWSEHCGYKHSAPLLKRLPSAGERVLQGPGRERGRARPRRRDGGRVQGRVAQPPVRGRAVPGRGDGDRRDPARRDRDGRAADRAARRALVRRARLPLPAGRRRHRPLRQLRRRADRRRPDGLRPRLRLELPRQRDVRRPRRQRPPALGQGERAGAARRPLRRDDRPRRNRRRVGARERRAERGRRRQAPLGPGRRSLHRQEADRGLARARRVGSRRVAAGLRRGRPRVVPVGDGGRRRRDRRPPRPRPAPRGGHGAVGDHDLGVAGADGRGRPARDARGGARRVRALGAAVHGDRRGDGFRRAARVLRRRRRGRDPRGAADRRVSAVRGRAARGVAARPAGRASGVRRSAR